MYRRQKSKVTANAHRQNEPEPASSLGKFLYQQRILMSYLTAVMVLYKPFHFQAELHTGQPHLDLIC